MKNNCKILSIVSIQKIRRIRKWRKSKINENTLKNFWFDQKDVMASLLGKYKSRYNGKLNERFSQNLELKKLLLNKGDAKLKEHTKNDHFWGN